MAEMRKDSLAKLQQRIGYTFKDLSLLEQACTHPSYHLLQEGESLLNNQRLEFLGDAVLSMVLAQALFSLYPDEREGFLTKARAALIQGHTLSNIARELELGETLLMSEADLRAGNHLRDAAQEDVFEALIGAVYLDSDWETTSHHVLGWYGDLRKRIDHAMLSHNPKGRLQEHLQKRAESVLPDYRIIESRGPDHDKTFVAQVWFDDACQGTGDGNSKKDAEENAAKQALIRLGDEDI